MTDTKQDADGYTVTGFIARNEAGDVRLTELGVIKHYTLDEFFEIMHPKNVCKKCGGNMRKGQALAQTWIGADDLGGVCTMSPGGPGELVDCLKCGQCGWSTT